MRMKSSASQCWTSPAWTTVIAGALVAFACTLAARTTIGLEWPCEMDFSRDMGGAQAILDGDAGADPAYLGERNWFNPLQPAAFAALSALRGLPLPSLYASWGPFVNLLGPVAFFLLARQLMGGMRRAAWQLRHIYSWAIPACRRGFKPRIRLGHGP